MKIKHFELVSNLIFYLFIQRFLRNCHNTSADSQNYNILKQTGDMIKTHYNYYTALSHVSVPAFRKRKLPDRENTLTGECLKIFLYAFPIIVH